MLLNAFERVTLLQVLPAKGDITTLRILQELKDSIGFSESEHAALKFKQTGERLEWDSTADAAKDVSFGRVALGAVRKAFQDLSDRKELHLSQLALYERFEKEDEHERA